MDDLLLSLAAKYIWWKTPEEALRRPRQVIAQVMDIGDYEDVRKMMRSLGDAPLRDALQNADSGQFNARSWHYWHYRLGLAELDQVPPLPVRKQRAIATLPPCLTRDRIWPTALPAPARCMVVISSQAKA